MSEQPRRVWRVLVPCIALAAGVMFATSAETAQGTDLRSDRRIRFEQLIEERNAQVQHDTGRVAKLHAEIQADTAAQSQSNARIRPIQQRANRLERPVGLTAVKGPGLTVVLDDAPRAPDGSLPPGASPDDVVVHQQDVQAVVNALWAGGGEAMTIMGQRVISTSAVRCVGNTLLLHGRVWSPPFTITAIGNPSSMRAALDREPGVRIFRQYVDAYGLGYQVKTRKRVTLPAYKGTLSLTHAEVAG